MTGVGVEDRVRECAVRVAGEAAGSVLYAMGLQNATLEQRNLPTWRIVQVDDEQDDTATFTFISAGPIYFDGNEIIGFHHTATGPHPLPGAETDLLPSTLPPVICSLCGTRRARTHLIALTPDGTVLYYGRPCVDLHPSVVRRPKEKRQDTDSILFNPVELAGVRETVIRNSPHYSIISVLAVALWLTDTEGYRSRNSNDVSMSTADRMQLLFSNNQVRNNYGIENNLLAAAVLRQCSLDEFDDELESHRQMKTLLRRDTVPANTFGRLAYLPTLYRRFEHERQRQREAAEAGLSDPLPEYADIYLGEPGQRITCHVLIESSRVLPSGSTLVTLKSDDGCRIVWFASDPTKIPPLGGSATMRGTVRQHNDFKGTKSTVVNRCVFI